MKLDQMRKRIQLIRGHFISWLLPEAPFREVKQFLRGKEPGIVISHRAELFRNSLSRQRCKRIRISILSRQGRERGNCLKKCYKRETALY
jgi:hypothetical protein